MDDFSADWLDQRESVDRAARNPRLLRRLSGWRDGRQKLRIIDLGAGTGSNFRFLAPFLGGQQHWLLVDKDPALLAGISPRLQHWAAASGLDSERKDTDLVLRGVDACYQVETRQLDLTVDLARLDLHGVDLVTASALLDLVSADWCAELAARCHGTKTTVFITLSYDGAIGWQPPDPDDARVRRLVNRHQRTDKGFGPALGPQAVAHLSSALKRLGYRVYRGRSDWQLGLAHIGIRQALAQGYAQAAQAIEPGTAPWLDAWLARRHETIRMGNLSVGHLDLFGCL